MSAEHTENPTSSPEMALKTPESRETTLSPDIEFFVTDHNTRNKEVKIESQRALYAEMKEHGISSVRFDWDWKDVIPAAGQVDETVLTRYAENMKAMQEAGLEPPILVLSNPPEWAAELYRTDKEAFFHEYEEYLSTATETLRTHSCQIGEAQLWNEINHAFLFKYIDIADMPRAASLARAALETVEPDIELSTSLVVGNFNDAFADERVKAVSEMNATLGSAQSLPEFLATHGDMLKASFDRISLDYYPGTWHFPVNKVRQPGQAFPIPVSVNPVKELGNRLVRTFKDMDMLEKACRDMAALGLPYEIGEAGMPTNKPYNNEHKQRLFYDMFFRGFRGMLQRLSEDHVPLPEKVGLYETQDEANVSFGGIFEKLLKSRVGAAISRLTPNPEHDFGLKDAGGQPKEILKGNLHGAENKHKPSQLRKLIEYVNRPIGKNE